MVFWNICDYRNNIKPKIISNVSKYISEQSLKLFSTLGWRQIEIKLLNELSVDSLCRAPVWFMFPHLWPQSCLKDLENENRNKTM